MDRMLYLASTTGREIMHAQAINSNNLANANTVGFRQDYAYAISQQVYGPGYDSRVYSATVGESSDFSPGPMVSTGRELDVAIKGDGWFAVQDINGNESYTRAGGLQINSLGLLTTGAGVPVIGNNAGPITIPLYDKLEIGEDGTISIVPKGQDATTLVVIDRIKMANPDVNQLEKGDDGLFRLPNNDVALADGAVKLVSGFIEGSNVNTVHAMISMMELARKFEMQIKLMENANQNDSATSKIMQMS